MQKKLLRMFVICFMIVGVSGIHAFSDDIKTRMIERLPLIKALKAKGIIGEDNKGYLQYVGTARESEDTVNAENQDRKKVYEAIAVQQGASADMVGAHRAIQLHERSAGGEWLQDAAGKWFQK